MMNPFAPRSEWLRRSRLRTHLIVITLLYFCQGLLQGCLKATPTLILQYNPQLSTAWQAILSLPVSAFVLKCLWSPVVDRLFLRCKPSAHRLSALCHRRVQWVFVLQLFLLILIMRLSLQPTVDRVLRADGLVVNAAVLWRVLVVLCFIAFSTATQDVAIDAWAVEGLPRSRPSLAGTMQLLGVVGGGLFVNLYVPFYFLFPTVCSATNFLRLTAVLLTVSLPLVLFLAHLEDAERTVSAQLRHHEEVEMAGEAVSPAVAKSADVAVSDRPPLSTAPTPAEPHTSVTAALRMLFVSPGTRDIMVVYTTRHWASGVEVLLISRLVSLGVVSASTLSRYTVYSIAVQLVLGPLTAPRVLARVSSARVCWLASAARACVVAASAVLFVVWASPSAAGWYGTWIVLPSLLLISVIGAYTYVADMTLASTFARRFPSDSGTVLTLLAAVSNFGYLLPGGACLFMASAVVLITSTLSGKDTRYGVHPTDSSGAAPSQSSTTSSHLAASPLWMVKLDVVFCATTFGALGVWLWSRLLSPASLALERHERASLANTDDAV